MTTNAHQPDQRYGRRDLLKLGAVGGLDSPWARPCGLPSRPQRPARWPGELEIKPIDPVRIGFVGVGGRGAGLVGELLKVEGSKYSLLRRRGKPGSQGPGHDCESGAPQA